MATINDLVLVHLDRKPAFYARLNDVSPDVKRGWYQVELLVLSLPPQTMVWILEEAQINGEEFTMGGRPVRLELLPPKPQPEPETSPPREARARSFPWCGNLLSPKGPPSAGCRESNGAAVASDRAGGDF